MATVVLVAVPVVASVVASVAALVAAVLVAAYPTVALLEGFEEPVAA